MRFPPAATVIDVGLRDGLQNEATDVPTGGKLRLARSEPKRQFHAAVVVRGIGEHDPTIDQL